jgi:Protein of unknown function (DUF1631)
MASQPEIVQSCAEEAAKGAQSAVEHCVDDAVIALQIAETQTLRVVERDQIAAAWRELQKNKSVWAAQYPVHLLKAFQAGISVAARASLLSRGDFVPVPAPEIETASAARLGSGSRFAEAGGLSLVDDDDVSQQIESSRLLQQLLPGVEQTLAELDKLISSAQGLPNVRPDLNPLRPEIFANTLRDLIFSTPAEAAVYALWIKHLSPPLGRELKRLYERVVNRLEMANIQGASYRVIQTGGGGGGGGPRGRVPSGETEHAASAGRGSGEGGDGWAQATAAGSAFGYVSDEPVERKPSQYADLSRDSVNDALFQDFLLRGGESADHQLAPAYYDNIDEELRALKGAPDSVPAPLDESEEETGPRSSAQQQLPPIDRPQRPVHERSQLSQKVWGAFGRHKERALVRTELKKKAKRVGQVMGLEVVHQLVNQVAQDPRLLSPVREGIVALEPSLLRLAMVDPRFFKDEAHPGRRLMERVAQRSFKYNSERGPEFGLFFDPVKSAFNALNRLTIADAQPFSQALAELENGWSQQDEDETARRNAVLQALRFAEERQVAADQIAFDLSKRSDLDEVPALVLDFLFGPWALAMAHARLLDTRNQIDPQGLGLVVPDLVWSAKRQMTMRQPAKLIEMIPGLLTRLHAGLELLDKDPRDSEAFFQGLMRIHQPVLKLRRLKSRRDAEESGNVPLEPEAMPATPEQRRARVAAQPWLGREDLEAAGFDDMLPSAHDDLPVPEKELEVSASVPPPDGEVLHDPQVLAPEGCAADEKTAAASDRSAQAAPDDGDTPDSDPDQSEQSDAASDAESVLHALRVGAWVDLFYRRRWLRAQLVWASSKRALFMFVSHGGRAHSMTRRTCERLIREQLLRPVDSQGVVAQALDAVVNEAAARAAPESAAAP